MINMKSLWMPMNFHGELDYPNGSDPEVLVLSALKSLSNRTRTATPPYSDIKYYVKVRQDGSRSLFFELV